MIGRVINSVRPYASSFPRYQQAFSAKLSSSCEGVQKVLSTGCKKPSREKKTLPDPITVTENAAKKINQFVLSEGKDPSEYGLRVGVVRSGCSGNSYSMSVGKLQDAKKNGDDVFYKDDALVIIEQKSLFTVIGSTLDYKESLFASGFEWENPNIKKSCGCGSSFLLDRKKRDKL